MRLRFTELMHLGWFCLFAKYYHGKGHTVCLVPYIYCVHCIRNAHSGSYRLLRNWIQNVDRTPKGEKARKTDWECESNSGSKSENENEIGWKIKPHRLQRGNRMKYNLTQSPTMSEEWNSKTNRKDWFNCTRISFFTTFSTYFLHMYIVRQTEMKPFAKPKYSQTIHRTT